MKLALPRRRFQVPVPSSCTAPLDAPRARIPRPTKLYQDHVNCTTLNLPAYIYVCSCQLAKTSLLRCTWSQVLSDANPSAFQPPTIAQCGPRDLRAVSVPCSGLDLLGPGRQRRPSWSFAGIRYKPSLPIRHRQCRDCWRTSMKAGSWCGRLRATQDATAKGTTS